MAERYDMKWRGDSVSMEPLDVGPWVRYEDYEALEGEIWKRLLSPEAVSAALPYVPSGTTAPLAADLVRAILQAALHNDKGGEGE